MGVLCHQVSGLLLTGFCQSWSGDQRIPLWPLLIEFLTKPSVKKSSLGVAQSLRSMTPPLLFCQAASEVYYSSDMCFPAVQMPRTPNLPNSRVFCCLYPCIEIGWVVIFTLGLTHYHRLFRMLVLQDTLPLLMPSI